MSFSLLRPDQTEQTSDLAQAFTVLRESRDRFAGYRGTMRRKTIRGSEYPYRRSGRKDIPLGPRSADTERAKFAFDRGRADVGEVHADGRNPLS